MEAQAAGLNGNPPTPPAGAENFTDLGDVDDSGAAVGYAPFFDGSNYVVRNWTEAHFGFGGQSSPTAWVHIGAGTAAAGTAQVKLDTSTLLGTPEAGAMEFSTPELYFTRAAARYKVLLSTLVDPTDITFGTSTGSKLGTATTEKISLWNKTPIVRPTALTAADNTVIDAVYDATEQAVLNNVRTRLNELETRLSSFGFLP